MIDRRNRGEEGKENKGRESSWRRRGKKKKKRKKLSGRSGRTTRTTDGPRANLDRIPGSCRSSIHAFMHSFIILFYSCLSLWLSCLFYSIIIELILNTDTSIHQGIDWLHINKLIGPSIQHQSYSRSLLSYPWIRLLEIDHEIVSSVADIPSRGWWGRWRRSSRCSSWL